MTIIKALVTILNILMIVVLISCIVEKAWKQDKAVVENYAESQISKSNRGRRLFFDFRIDEL